VAGLGTYDRTCWYDDVEDEDETEDASEKTEALSESEPELPLENWDKRGERFGANEPAIGDMTGLGSWDIP
jgi:hypothetical protein